MLRSAPDDSERGAWFQRAWSACSLLAAALMFAGAASAAEPVAPCAAFDALAPEPGAVRGCLLERQRAWGPDDPRLLPFLAEAAAAFLRDDDTAVQALPYRKRAYSLTKRLKGEGRETADAALAYARSWILSGRCTAMDARIQPLVEDAARGYAALLAGEPARRDGLRAAALAYADGMYFQQASATLMLIEPAPESRDWERIGRWRRFDGDLKGAATATARALDGAIETHRRTRLKQDLKRLYFELGDLGAAARLDAVE